MNLTVRDQVCRIMCDAEWNYSKVNALVGLGFQYADAVVVSPIENAERYAISCTYAPLMTALEAFLIVFDWKCENGILFSPPSSPLNGGDLIALINNTKKAIVERLS